MTRTGAALNRYTHQFTFLALVLGAEALGRHRGPGGATSRPPRASAPQAVAPRSAPSGAAPAAARSGGAGWQEHCALGDEQVTTGEPGAPRPAGTKLIPHRAPLRPQLLPGERVADPVAPPLLRLRTQPLGLRLLPGPVPAVSAAAPRGHRRDGLIGHWRLEPLRPARPAWPAPGTECAVRAPRPLLLALRPGGFPAGEPRSGPSRAAPQPQPVPRDRAENRVKSPFRIKRRSRRQDGDSWFWKEKNTCERPIFCRR